MSSGEIIAGFAVSVVGFSVFVFGKKQQRPPQLVAGMVLMMVPLVMHDPVWVGVIALAVLLGMRLVIRAQG